MHVQKTITLNPPYVAVTHGRSAPCHRSGARLCRGSSCCRSCSSTSPWWLGRRSVAIYYSMTDWNGIGAATWVGLDNFRTLADDPGLPSRVPEQCHLVGDVPHDPDRDGADCGKPAGAGEAGRICLFRMTLFIPYVLPSVITAALWRGLLSPDRGIPALLTDCWRSWIRQGVPRRPRYRARLRLGSSTTGTGGAS